MMTLNSGLPAYLFPLGYEAWSTRSLCCTGTQTQGLENVRQAFYQLGCRPTEAFWSATYCTHVVSKYWPLVCVTRCPAFILCGLSSKRFLVGPMHVALPGRNVNITLILGVNIPVLSFPLAPGKLSLGVRYVAASAWHAWQLSHHCATVSFDGSLLIHLQL